MSHVAHPVPLNNFGTVCHFNAVIQALMSIDVFRKTLWDDNGILSIFKEYGANANIAERIYEFLKENNADVTTSQDAAVTDLLYIIEAMPKAFKAIFTTHVVDSFVCQYPDCGQRFTRSDTVIVSPAQEEIVIHMEGFQCQKCKRTNGVYRYKHDATCAPRVLIVGGHKPGDIDPLVEREHVLLKYDFHAAIQYTGSHYFTVCKWGDATYVCNDYETPFRIDGFLPDENTLLALYVIRSA